MDKKPTRGERRKLARATAAPDVSLTPTAGEVIRRRRNRRMLFLGLVAVLLPTLEVVAYQFRSILIVVANRSDQVVTNVKVTYPGGEMEAKEIKPGGELTHVARPDYSFTKQDFSSYRVNVSASTATGAFRLIEPKVGTVDYSARETFAIQPEGENGPLTIKHTTYPGFPLGPIRDLLTQLGVS